MVVAGRLDAGDRLLQRMLLEVGDAPLDVVDEQPAEVHADTVANKHALDDDRPVIWLFAGKAYAGTCQPRERSRSARSNRVYPVFRPSFSFQVAPGTPPRPSYTMSNNPIFATSSAMQAPTSLQAC